MTTEDPEPEYYEMTLCEHVYTTHSGQKVYSTQCLLVPMPDNDEDTTELTNFHATYSKDCMDGLSDCSHTHESNSDPNEEEDVLLYDEEDNEESAEDETDSVLCDSDKEDTDEGEELENSECQIKNGIATRDHSFGICSRYTGLNGKKGKNII